MKEINVEKWGRSKTYNFFKSFSDSTYSCSVRMDVTKLVEHSKSTGQSFFIDMLYIVVNALNSIDEMRMRIVDGKPVIFEDINPACTVMTKSGFFDNARFENNKDFESFYRISKEKIENIKNELELNQNDFNPQEVWNEYYITCLPWIDITQFTNPIPDSIESQCIPRICWGKYTKENDKYKMTLNITASHIFVDGYPLSKAFMKIQELLDDVENILK